MTTLLSLLPSITTERWLLIDAAQHADLKRDLTGITLSEAAQRLTMLVCDEPICAFATVFPYISGSHLRYGFKTADGRQFTVPQDGLMASRINVKEWNLFL